MKHRFSDRTGFVDLGGAAFLPCTMDTTTNDPLGSHAAQQAEALLQSAVQAAQAGDDDRSLSLLRESVRARHHNPLAHHLLGAELAQRKQFGDALLHLSLAVDQAPQLALPRLQLALLWLTQGNPSQSLSQLRPLAELPEGNAVRHFGDALASLCHDDLAAAERHLVMGLACESDNAPLRADMQHLLAAVQAQLSSAAAGGVGAADALPVSHGMAISAYCEADSREGLPRR